MLITCTSKAYFPAAHILYSCHQYVQISDVKSKNVNFYIPLTKYKLIKGLKVSPPSQATDNVTKAREFSKKNIESYIYFME